MDYFENEAGRGGYRLIAGVDEAGRGPLAGPVVASAVIFSKPPILLGIKDSKKLSPQKRQTLSALIYREAKAVGVGIVWPDEIDRINIHNASLKAMENAVKALSIEPDFILVDGIYKIPALPVEQRAVTSGDNLSVTVAAASIIAKVTRDAIMAAYHAIYPDYNFIRNKGYPTLEHVGVLRRIGPSPIHRKTFSYGKTSGKKNSKRDACI